MSQEIDFEIPPGVPTYAAIRDQLRADILSGEIAGGMRLTTASLVKRFGVSQMPIREALQALEGERLVDIQPHKGANVLYLDARRVRNIYDLRAAIEGLLYRLSLPNLTNAAMAELARLHEQIQTHAAHDEPEEVFRINHQFHHLIYRHADNPEALETYDRYANLLGTLRGNFGYSSGRVREMVEQHDDILQALREQDVDRLERVSRIHVEGAKQDLLRCMAETPATAAAGHR